MCCYEYSRRIVLMVENDDRLSPFSGHKEKQVNDGSVNGENGAGAGGEGGQPGSGGDSGAANGAAAQAAAGKRRIRSPEEIVKDIDAEAEEQIKKIKERAAAKKAEVAKKVSASNRKNVALEVLDKQRAGVRAALKNDKLDDAACDAELAKIVDAGLAALAESALLAA